MNLFLSKSDRIRYLGFDDIWAALIFIPLIAGLAFLLFAGAETETSGNGIMACYLVGLLHTLFYWVVNRAFIIELRRRLPRQEQTLRRIILMLTVAASSVLFFELFSDRIIQLVYPALFDFGWGGHSFIFGFVVSLTLCLLVIAIYEFIYFFGKYRHSLLEREQLAKANMQAQLAALKQQVNPHFLFNSLNTLTNIIPENPDLATRFVQRLSAVYRRILEYRHRELIPLREEILALQDYVFLMKTRFEDKLNVYFYYEEEGQQFVFHPDTMPNNLAINSGRIVPLALQLLVENAIKHNVVSTDKPLTVHIHIRPQRVSVTNNLQPRQRRLQSTGVGHQLIRQRYHLTGIDKNLEIKSSASDYQISVPLIFAEKPHHYATA